MSRNRLQLIHLASVSPRRRELLRKMGIRFRIAASRYREMPWRNLRDGRPSDYVMKTARGKASHAHPAPAHGWILGADTVIYFQKQIWGKPANLRDAARMLRAFSGRTHAVYTGIAIVDAKTGECRTAWDRSRVTFFRLRDDTIRRYLQRVNALDKAGGYAVQDGADLIRRVRGSFTNVMGLPTELLARMLKGSSRYA